MPISLMRVQDELMCRNHTPEFAQDMNPTAFTPVGGDLKTFELASMWTLATTNYAFLLPSGKETTLEEWSGIIDERYNSPQAQAVAAALLEISKKYSD